MLRHLCLMLRFAILMPATLLLGCQPLLPLPPISILQPQPATGIPTEQSVGLAANVIPATVASHLDLTGTLSAPVTTPIAITTTTPLTVATNDAAVSTERSAELVAAGEEIYLKQYCGICHQLDALETRGTFGPTHNGIGQRAAERIQDPTYHGHARTAAEYLMESLIDPTIYIVPDYALTSHPMPDYSYLSEADLEALVALLLQR